MLRIHELIEIKRRRADPPLKHAALAALTGLGQTTVQRILRGGSAGRRSSLQLLVQALGLPLGVLMVPDGASGPIVAMFQWDALEEKLDLHARIVRDEILGGFQVVESCPGVGCVVCGGA